MHLIFDPVVVDNDQSFGLNLLVVLPILHWEF